jgi:hypothetical protein
VKVPFLLFSAILLLTRCYLLVVDPTVLARGTPGFSGAELQNMVK